METILYTLLMAANSIVPFAKHRVLLVDKTDKRAKMYESASITHNVSGTCVQQALLK